MNSGNEHKSSINFSKGMVSPSSVNEKVLHRLKKKKHYSVDEYLEGILSRNRIILSQAITLIESSLPKHQNMAQEIIEKCLPYSGKSIRIGITGVPGAGKSSFIEALGIMLTSQGQKIAVLAIDPTSERSKGSILGDKTRMESLATDQHAFIRPSPSAGTPGGVARKTRETIFLCEAAGFDIIFVETVGVGQSETAVHSMVDFFLLLMLAGAGDELQGIKRGIFEMADLVAITKADGTNIKKPEQAMAAYTSALHLFPPSESGWIPRVLTCSAYQKTGIERIWNLITEYKAFTVNNDFFSKKRKEQSLYWMYETINQNLKENFYHSPDIKKLLARYEKRVLEDKISSFMAARLLLKKYHSGQTG
ncbi:MAG TPA: methylmalonyl Co-A mutase-associated GTPase MeaB [Bacteroidales bacterium]|nr:methylmalonyl Co-A mutase-associated GTPase MeaB [Bacteroidales bacterium]